MKGLSGWEMWMCVEHLVELRSGKLLVSMVKMVVRLVLRMDREGRAVEE